MLIPFQGNQLWTETGYIVHFWLLVGGVGGARWCFRQTPCRRHLAGLAGGQMLGSPSGLKFRVEGAVFGVEVAFGILILGVGV